uniref:NPC1 n=1 Tax=Ornithodoros moubata TaxID=6938 RepID=Q6QVL7_ORNMO|nr:NPC1 precursor [Ornithodoros moubata]
MQSDSLVSAFLCFTLVSTLASASRCVMRGHCGHDEDLDKAVPCKVDHEPKPLLSSNRDLLSEVCPDIAAALGPDRRTCCDVEQLQALKDDLQQPIDLGMKDSPRCLKNFRNIFCQILCSPRQSDFVKVVTAKNNTMGLPYATEAVYAVSEKFAKGSYDSCKNVKVKKILNMMYFMCGWTCNANKWFTFLGSTSSEGGYSPYKIDFRIVEDSKVKVHGTDLKPMYVDLA